MSINSEREDQDIEDKSEDHDDACMRMLQGCGPLTEYRNTRSSNIAAAVDMSLLKLASLGLSTGRR